MQDAEEIPVSYMLNMDAVSDEKPLATVMLSPTEALVRGLDSLSLTASSSTRHNDGDDEYKLNPVTEKHLPMSSFVRSEKNNDTDNTNRVFMCGDAPSKFDRDIFLAVQGIKLNPHVYPLLSSWYAYMRSKQADMQSWKTPTKKTSIKQF